MKAVTPSRDSIVSMQVHTLLNIAATLTNSLLHTNNLFSEPHIAKPELDGGVKSAIETTLINTCARLDEVVKDPSRWGMDAQNTLEAGLAELQREHLKLLHTQAEVTRTMDLPHMRYRPSLMRLASGGFLAILGSLEDLNNSIFGVGDSPAQALKAFDEIFSGKLPLQMMDWLAAHENALKDGIETPEFPPKSKRSRKKK